MVVTCRNIICLITVLMLSVYGASAQNDPASDYTAYGVKVFYGDIGVAQDHSKLKSEFVIYLKCGRDTEEEHRGEDYIIPIMEQIFNGAYRIPITFVIGEDVAGGNPLMDVYNNGHMENLNDGQKYIPRTLHGDRDRLVQAYRDRH